jgi:hypothetical protein
MRGSHMRVNQSLSPKHLYNTCFSSVVLLFTPLYHHPIKACRLQGRPQTFTGINIHFIRRHKATIPIFSPYCFWRLEAQNDAFGACNSRLNNK